NGVVCSLFATQGKLSVKSYGDHVQHFKVLQDRSCQYYVWDELFSSLNELVEFYHSNSIAKERTVFLRDPEHFARVEFACLICGAVSEAAEFDVEVQLVKEDHRTAIASSRNRYVILGTGPEGALALGRSGSEEDVDHKAAKRS
ncbi:hypothetical protein KUCAC02_007316, partial [Chaenocephalus aceratus]